MTTIVIKSEKDLKTILEFAKSKGIQLETKTKVKKRNALQKEILELSKKVNKAMHEKYVKPLLK